MRYVHGGLSSRCAALTVVLVLSAVALTASASDGAAGDDVVAVTNAGDNTGDGVPAKESQATDAAAVEKAATGAAAECGGEAQQGSEDCAAPHTGDAAAPPTAGTDDGAANPSAAATNEPPQPATLTTPLTEPLAEEAVQCEVCYTAVRHAFDAAQLMHGRCKKEHEADVNGTAEGCHKGSPTRGSIDALAKGLCEELPTRFQAVWTGANGFGLQAADEPVHEPAVTQMLVQACNKWVIEKNTFNNVAYGLYVYLGGGEDERKGLLVILCHAACIPIEKKRLEDERRGAAAADAAVAAAAADAAAAVDAAVASAANHQQQPPAPATAPEEGPSDASS